MGDASPWSDDEDAYLRQWFETKSHAALAAEMGRTRSGVRNRCWRLGLRKRVEYWSDAEVVLLREAYEAAGGGAFDLTGVAESLGRLKSNVCRKARELGLTDNSRPMATERTQAMAARSRKWHEANEHPRGFKGETHTAETRLRLGEVSKEWWDSLSAQARADHTMASLKTRERNGTLTPPRHKTTWRQGWRTIGDTRAYFRSRWEANYARYLQLLLESGKIARWEHEPETFWFEKVKRGARSYLPDFRVTYLDESVEYHEVKGWMDARSLTKLKRMKKYYPKVKMVVIREDFFKANGPMLSGICDGWE